MKHTLILAIVFLFCVSLAVYAQEKTTETKTTDTKTTETKATETKATETKAAETKAKIEVVTGQVISIDKAKYEFVLKTKDGDKTIQADAKLIEKLKEGEDVKVTLKAGTTTADRIRPVKKIIKKTTTTTETKTEEPKEAAPAK